MPESSIESIGKETCSSRNRNLDKSRKIKKERKYKRKEKTRSVKLTETSLTNNGFSFQSSSYSNYPWQHLKF